MFYIPGQEMLLGTTESLLIRPILNKKCLQDQKKKLSCLFELPHQSLSECNILLWFHHLSLSLSLVVTVVIIVLVVVIVVDVGGFGCCCFHCCCSSCY